jgi:guanylate cyclase
LDCKCDIVSQEVEGDTSHVVFQLHFRNDAFIQSQSNANISTHSADYNKVANLQIKSEIFFELFPFHIVFKRNLDIVSIGDGLQKAMKHAEGESLKDVFQLIRPLIPFTWDNVRNFIFIFWNFIFL